MYLYESYYKKYSNQILNWLPMDTEDLYRKNLKNRYSDLERFGWIDRSFTYQFNSIGFRCEEFLDSPSIMYLGCSNTLGIGLPLEDTWPQLLSKKLKLKCANLAQGGGSLDTAFRLCHGFIDKIKPQIVILLIPPGTRIENFINSHPAIFSVNRLDLHDNFLKHFFLDERNYFFNKEKNIQAIKSMCQDRNIKFLYESSEELLMYKSLARDLMHPGIESNKMFVDKILKKI